MPDLLTNNNPHFQYDMLPYAAQLAEAPAYYAFAALKSDTIPIAVLGYLAGFVAVPLSIALTPLTILADIIIGIAETCFCCYKGATYPDIKELFIRKVVLSPTHQLLSALVRAVLFETAPIFWTLGYAASQGVILLLPDFMNHKRVNIFINGGITDKDSTKNWFDQDDDELPKHYNTSQEYDAKDELPKQHNTNEGRGAKREPESNFTKCRDDAAKEMNNVNYSPITEEYAKLKQKIWAKSTARELFDFGPNDTFTKTDLIKKFKQLARIVHPDKNPQIVEEAHLIFTCVEAAFQELVKPFNR